MKREKKKKSIGGEDQSEDVKIYLQRHKAVEITKYLDTNDFGAQNKEANGTITVDGNTAKRFLGIRDEVLMKDDLIS
jgi:hypothetical protein